MAAKRRVDGWSRGRVFQAAAALILIALLTAPVRAAEPVRIFAAASTIAAVNEAISAFGKRTHIPVAPVFASSGALARQLAAGAPGHVFLSANKKWMDWAETQGAIEAGTRRVLLTNKLVVAAAKGSNAKLAKLSRDAFLEAAQGKRIAIADPAHAPLGAHTRDALRWLGVWREVGPRALRMSDAARARALVERGEAALGILYESDVVASARLIRLAVFPAESHKPIAYEIALTRTGQDDRRAAEFLAWLTGAEARPIFAKYGFGAD